MSYTSVPYNKTHQQNTRHSNQYQENMSKSTIVGTSGSYIMQENNIKITQSGTMIESYGGYGKQLQTKYQNVQSLGLNSKYITNFQNQNQNHQYPREKTKTTYQESYNKDAQKTQSQPSNDQKNQEKQKNHNDLGQKTKDTHLSTKNTDQNEKQKELISTTEKGFFDKSNQRKELQSNSPSQKNPIYKANDDNYKKNQRPHSNDFYGKQNNSWNKSNTVNNNNYSNNNYSYSNSSNYYYKNDNAYYHNNYYDQNNRLQGYSPSYGYQNYPSQSYNIPSQLVHLMVGFPNIGLTCYINSTLQSFKQIYYLDKKIFEYSIFGQELIKLFQDLEIKSPVSKQLEKILKKSTSYQEHRGGGDAYACAINFLTEIKKSIHEGKCQENFVSNFVIKERDQLYCSQCTQPYKQSSQNITCLVNENIGFETPCLDNIFNSDSNLVQKEKIKCTNCQKLTEAYGLKDYLSAPAFMFVRVTNYKTNKVDFLDKSYECIDQYQKYHTYKVIGFCSYYGNHYTYTGNYQNTWIEYDDSKVSITEPDNRKAFYYLLKKVD